MGAGAVCVQCSSVAGKGAGVRGSERCMAWCAVQQVEEAVACAVEAQVREGIRRIGQAVEQWCV